MKKALLLLVFFCCHFALIAQRNYQPGTIIRVNGQTESGFIDDKEWITNPKKITFRKTLDDSPVELGLADLSSFAVTGKERYVKAVVTKDMRPVTVEDLNDFPGELTATDTVFLKELFPADKISLYMLHDFKDHFFVKEESGAWVELKYSLDYSRENSTYSKRNTFQNQLLNYFPDIKEDAKFVAYVEKLSYDEKDLTNLFYKITKTPKKTTRKMRPVFFAGTGIQVSKFKVSGNTPIADESYNSSVTPLYFVGCDIGSSKNRGAFVFRALLEYNSFNYKGNYTRNIFPNSVMEESYVLKVNNIRASIALLYNFLRSSKSRAYLGAEAFVNASTYKENVFTRKEVGANKTVIDDYYSYEKSWIGLNANVGYIFRNKLDFSANYKVFGSFSKMVGVGISPDIISFRLAYRL